MQIVARSVSEEENASCLQRLEPTVEVIRIAFNILI